MGILFRQLFVLLIHKRDVRITIRELRELQDIHSCRGTDKGFVCFFYTAKTLHEHEAALRTTLGVSFHIDVARSRTCNYATMIGVLDVCTKARSYGWHRGGRIVSLCNGFSV